MGRRGKEPATTGSNSNQACRNSLTSQAGIPAVIAVDHTTAATATQSAADIDKEEFGEGPLFDDLYGTLDYVTSTKQTLECSLSVLKSYTNHDE